MWYVDSVMVHREPKPAVEPSGRMRKHPQPVEEASVNNSVWQADGDGVTFGTTGVFSSAVSIQVSKACHEARQMG